MLECENLRMKNLKFLFLPQFSPALKGVEAKAYAQIEK
jgi:hypothetical protein